MKTKRQYLNVCMWWISVLALLMPLTTVGAPQEEKGREDPVERARLRMMQRADETGRVRPNALVDAKKEIDRLRALQQSFGVSKRRGITGSKGVRQTEDGGISNWEWLGPGNVGGRIRSILIHPTNPNTIWIGSVSGGIWRTDNAGASWYPVDDFMANLAVTSLVMDPKNYNVLYAGTGEGFGNGDGLQGAGVFKSTDAGVTWSQLPSTKNWLYVGRLAHHPDSSGVLLAAISGGVWKTTNGGATWNNVLFPPSMATDVQYHPSFANNVLVGTMTGAYYSSDYGTTFNMLTTGNPGKLPLDTGRCEVAFAPSTLLVMYVSMNKNGGEIWRGNFGAATWTLMNTGSGYLGDQGDYANPIWVDPMDPDIIVIGGLGCARSTDGGSTLVDILPLHADNHIIVNDPGYNGTTNRKVYVGTDGGLQVTQDIRTITRRSEWTELNNNLGITQFYGGSAALDGSIIVGGTQDNSQDHYRPAWGTEGWTIAPFGGDGGFSAVNYNTPNVVFGEFQYLGIERSTDGGTTYAQKISGLQDFNNKNLTLFIAPFVMDPNNPTILVAGGKRIWRTINSGDDWYRIRDSIPSREKCSAVDIAAGNSNIIWVGYNNGTVSYSTNAGASWMDVDAELPNRYITDIAINPVNSSEVIVTTGYYSYENVWMTTNSGGSWTRIIGTYPFSLPAIQVNTVRYNPQNENWIYIGTDLGVFASEDKGLHWNVVPLYAANEGPANVAVDELFWQGSEYLIAATHGRGMFRARILTDVYVNIDNTGFQDGTFQYPYQLIQDAINTAGNGSNIHIYPGDYLQAPLTFFKRGRLIAPLSSVIIH